MIFRNTLICAFAIACSMNSTIPAWGQQEAERQVYVDAAMGQTMRLRGHVSFSQGCSIVIPNDITVIQTPLRDADNKRRSCSLDGCGTRTRLRRQ